MAEHAALTIGATAMYTAGYFITGAVILIFVAIGCLLFWGIKRLDRWERSRNYWQNFGKKPLDQEGQEEEAKQRDGGDHDENQAP